MLLPMLRKRVVCIFGSVDLCTFNKFDTWQKRAVVGVE